MSAETAINTLVYTEGLCVNCGRCIEVCPHAVFAENGKAVRLQNADGCMECGACAINCPADAIKVDSGVGCAYAMMRDSIWGRSSNDNDCCVTCC